MREDDVEQLLRDIHYHLIRLSRPRFQDLGLTPPRFHTLAMVVVHGPLTMSAIHAKLHVSKSTVTALVDGLVSDGLIRRDKDEDDRRKVVLSATDAGRGVLETLRAHRCGLVEAALKDVPADHRECMVETLSRMKKRLGEKET